MKKIFIFALFLSSLSIAFSQNTDYADRMEHIFGNIDPSKVTTGYLKEFGIRFNEVEVYNGTIATNNFVDKTQWQSLYSSLYTMRVGTVAQNMVAPATIFNNLKTQQAGTSDILLAVQHYTYQQYKANAYTNGDVTINNERIYDVAGRNPYETKRIFAAAPLKSVLQGNTFTFKLPSTMVYGNTGLTPIQIQVDFGNGQGYQTVLYDTPISVTYALGGEKEIKIKFVYGLLKGATYYSHSKIYVDYVPPVFQARFNDSDLLYDEEPVMGNSWQGSVATGFVTVELAQGHTQLTKPLIVVEGFDPDNSFNYKSFINRDKPGGINIVIDESTNLTLNQAIEDEGYDLVFINYANGTDYIQRNAYMVKEVIKRVNDIKVGNEKNVVLGMSMGGLVARYALRDMELNNETHDTKLYISHDAPHQGANVPVAVQAFVRHMVGEDINLPVLFSMFNFNVEISTFYEDFPIEELQEGYNILQTPAAQQMLIYQLQGTGSGLSINNNSLHNSFSTEYKNMGYPQQGGIRNIAIANGSECGTPLGFLPYATLANVNETISLPGWSQIVMALYHALAINPGKFLSTIFATDGDIRAKFDMKALPNQQSKQIYKGEVYIRKTILFFIEVHEHLIDAKTLNSSSAMLPLDNAGGGVYDIEAFVSLPSDFENFVNETSFNFIPTYSSLDISGGNQTMLYSDLTKAYSPLSPPLSPKNTPFHNFYTNPTTSQNHIQFTLENGNWLLDELQGENAFYSCVSSCTTAKLPLMIYGGTEQLCNNATSSYTLLNLNPDSGAIVTWSVNPSGAVSNIVSNGNSVTITSSGNLNGWASLQASISTDCGEKTIGRSIYMGAKRPQFLDLYGEEIFHIEACTSIHEQLYFSLPNNGYSNQWEWRKILGNFTLQSSLNHGTIIGFQSTSGIIDVRAYDDECGWSPRTMITINITNCSGGGFEPQFTAYPNPATDVLNIQESTNQSNIASQNMNSTLENFPSSSTLYNFSGNPVRNISPATGTIDLQGLLAGHYILVITYDNETESHHILIQ